MSTTTTAQPDVHIGDVGTKFKGDVLDRGVPFNPTGATVAQLIFKTPSGTVFERTATITTATVGATQHWYAEYTTVQADIDAGLHLSRGRYYWQAYFEFSGGSKFSSDIASYLVEVNLRPVA